jgi:hypothetical protein
MPWRKPSFVPKTGEEHRMDLNSGSQCSSPMFQGFLTIECESFSGLICVIDSVRSLYKGIVLNMILVAG